MNNADILDRLLAITSDIRVLMEDIKADMKQELEDLKAERVQKLKEMLDEHDCHLSPNDSCPCTDWKQELADLTF